MPTENQILERMPVWEALSELFLDDELSQEDCQRMASVLAGSRYSVKELQEILRHEVYPACALNLICVAGPGELGVKIGFGSTSLRDTTSGPLFIFQLSNGVPLKGRGAS